jgi:hypothetical protein
LEFESELTPEYKCGEFVIENYSEMREREEVIYSNVM